MHGSDGSGRGRGRSSRPLRVALYSHDAQGLGHLRRNLAIAGALAEPPLSPDVLLITGTPYSRAFDLPAGADCLTLPALHKGAAGTDSGRLSPEVLVEVRAQAIAGALQAFDPDLLIVDKLPRGAFDELQPALNRRRHSGGRTVLGLRDVLDTPSTAIWEWQQTRATEAVAEYYDAVWVYGDPRVFDPVAEYSLPPAVAAKVHYTGYLAPAVPRPVGPAAPLVLCLVGGGQDGYALARVFLEADLPPDAMGLVVTDPHMPVTQREHLERISRERGQSQVRRFVSGTLDLLAQAHAVVSMGGYTTVCEILASRVPAFIVPRVMPSQEQLIRARHLQALGAVDAAAPEHVTAPLLTEWIQRALPPTPRGRPLVATDGLAAVRQLAAALCGRSPVEVGQAAS